MNYTKANTPKLNHFLSMPFIYGMIIPLLGLHLTLEIYHTVCFKLYRIEYVDRSKYIKIDRHKLSKLTGMQKLNCVYCGYANGLLPYATQITAETEKYWCGIKHEVDDDKAFIEPAHHSEFIDYSVFK